MNEGGFQQRLLAGLEQMRADAIAEVETQYNQAKAGLMGNGETINMTPLERVVRRKMSANGDHRVNGRLTKKMVLTKPQWYKVRNAINEKDPRLSEEERYILDATYPDSGGGPTGTLQQIAKGVGIHFTTVISRRLQALNKLGIRK